MGHAGIPAANDGNTLAGLKGFCLLHYACDGNRLRIPFHVCALTAFLLQLHTVAYYAKSLQLL